MAFLEVLSINLAAAVIKVTAKLWLGDYVAEATVAPVTETLAETLKRAIPDFDTRENADLLFKDLQNQVARRLRSVTDSLFPELPDNEREAAILAVSDVFQEMSLQRELFEADLDAVRLERIAQPHAHRCFNIFGQGTETQTFARLILRESCNFAVVLAGKMPNFQVSATRAILKRYRDLGDELEKVLDAVVAMREEASDAERRVLQNFELQYRRTLVQRLDRLELFGLRLIGAGAREYPLSVAYVTLTASSTRPREPQRVDAALSGKSRILIRGEAGSGKSTLLQWLAVRAANRDFDEILSLWNGRMPIYIRLRDYAERELPSPEIFLEGTAKNLLDLMPEHWCHDALPHALVLIDGVDELPAERRRGFTSWVRDLVTDFDDAIFVVTSRPAALDAKEPLFVGQELARRGFSSLILEPMTLADSEALVAQWHSAVARDRPEEASRLHTFERDLRQALRDRPPIRNLASNPLLCSMICALNWDRRQRLPDDRMELYRLALEMLLERRDEERAVRPAHVGELTRTEREELIDQIAYWMLRNRYTEAEQERVEEQIARVLPRFAKVNATASEVLQELLERSGILRRPQYGTVDFIHRTFLEYMAARAAIASGDSGVLVEGAVDESWRETVVFAAGHAKGKARSELVAELLKRPWFKSRPLEAQVTAACCLETVGRNLEPDLLAKLRDLTRKLFPPADSETARILAPAAAMEPELLEGHAKRGEDRVAACIRTAAIVGGNKMLETIANYAVVPGIAVDGAIIHAWSAFDVDEFAGKVVLKRGTLYGHDVNGLSDEEFQCLALLIDYDNTVPKIVFDRLDKFKQDHTLELQRQHTIQNNDEGFLRRLLLVREDKASAVSSSASLRPFQMNRLSRLTSLESLSLPNIEPAEMADMPAMINLRRLDLELREQTDLDPLARLSQLEKISLRGSGVRNLRPLQQCLALREISLNNCAISEEDLLSLPPHLHKISLEYLPLNSLERLSNVNNLEEIRLFGLKIDDLNVLSDLPALRKIEILYPQSEHLKLRLEKLSKVEYLWITQVPGYIMMELSNMPHLKELIIVDQLRGNILTPKFPDTLENLTIFHAKINLVNARAPNLRTVHFSNVEVSGAQELLSSPYLSYITWSTIPHDIKNSLVARGVHVA